MILHKCETGQLRGREGPPVGSSTTRSENQAELQTSARTKTAVVQRCSAAGAGTITTIRYPAQLWAISWSFLPTAVLQKLSYHYLLQGDKMLQHNLWIGPLSAQPQTHHILRGVCSAVLWRAD